VTWKLPPTRTDPVSDLVPSEVHQSAAGRRLSADGSVTVDLLRSATRPSAEFLIWLGAAGFALAANGRLVLIDPYLSDSLAAKYRGRLFPHIRLFPTPIAPREIVGVEAVLHTHGHTDHLDPWTIADLVSNGAKAFVVPKACQALAVERGVPAGLLIEAVDGSRLEVAALSITAIPAAHEELLTDADGNHSCLGYVIDTGLTRIYHSGDCVPYPGLAERLRELSIDIALLPINGRDQYRSQNGVPGNFTVAEAVELCRSAGIPELLCHHFGLFDFNTVPPAVALRELVAVDDVGWTLPAVGAGFLIERERS
jgi:L-ascorbate metabolism protein UlaG (beta-lactamase superfamily)